MFNFLQGLSPFIFFRFTFAHSVDHDRGFFLTSFMGDAEVASTIDMGFSKKQRGVEIKFGYFKNDFFLNPYDFFKS